MRAEIKKGKMHGSISAPPSKSFAHRALICAALSDGKSEIAGISDSDDIAATERCIKALGADISRKDNSTLIITGRGKNINPNGIYNCHESGSTLRFMMPVSILKKGTATLYGTKRLISRGVGVYNELLGKKNIDISLFEDKIEISGLLTSGSYKMPGNISSQFATGMLLALPLTGFTSTLEITPPVESRKYIDITIDIMRRFSAYVEEKSKNLFTVHPIDSYTPTNVQIEGDWSNAAFFLALKSLGKDVEVTSLNKNSLQSDRVCEELFLKLDEKEATIDVSGCPDLAPILFSVAAAKNGALFTGTKRLAIKESDRAACMAEELLKFGIKCEMNDNSLKVLPGDIHRPDTELCGHNDHRIVMALSVLSTLTGGTITEAEAINKSFPDFFERLCTLGAKIDIYE